FAADAVAVTPDDLAHAVVAECVGEGPAAELAAFRRLYRELPDVDAALTAPDVTPVPREPAVLYALVGALVERCRADAGPVANFVKYATRMPDEFALLALRDLLSLKPKLASNPAVQAWIAKARTKGLFLAA